MPTPARPSTVDAADSVVRTSLRCAGRHFRLRAVAAVAVLGALLTAEAALAQSGGTQTGPVAEPLIIVERSDQVVEFGPRTITGKVAVPGGALVRVRPPGSRRQLIGLRSNFRAQLRQTVDAL